MMGESGPPSKMLADELRQVIRRWHDLGRTDTPQALIVIVADELGKMALDVVATSGQVPSRAAAQRQLVTLVRAFANAEFLYARWALPDTEPDDPLPDLFVRKPKQQARKKKPKPRK